MNPRPSNLTTLASLVLALAGCGYVGDPKPPALNIPEPIKDLRGMQRGDKIFVSFTPSFQSTDGLILKSLDEIDLRAGAIPEGPFDVNHWADNATRIPVPNVRAEGEEIAFFSAAWVGKEVIVGVRSVGPSGRPSQWSHMLSLHIVPAPQTPMDVAVSAEVKGAWLHWKGSGTQWKIWRLAEGDKAPALLGTAGELSWMDSSVEFGKTYTYQVQQIVPDGSVPAESEMSSAVSVKYEDRFPPAVPSGLTVIAGLKSVELAWERNTETDFSAYQVFRAESGAPLKKLGPPIKNPSYSDAAVESGKNYRYAVSAIDELGNESQPCTPAEIVAP